MIKHFKINGKQNTTLAYINIFKPFHLLIAKRYDHLNDLNKQLTNESNNQKYNTMQLQISQIKEELKLIITNATIFKKIKTDYQLLRALYKENKTQRNFLQFLKKSKASKRKQSSRDKNKQTNFIFCSSRLETITNTARTNKICISDTNK